MKKVHFSFFLIFATVWVAFSQVPASFNYQAVIRNSSGEILANKTVNFRISLLMDSETGDIVYSETHSITTNEYGLVNLKIGKGQKLSGTFSPSNWGEVIFTKIDFDPTGESSFSHLSTTKLSSVPYAFKAQTVVDDKIDDADADPANELQTMSISGTVLTLSDGGGSITLPSSGSGGDNWGTQNVVSDATLSGEGTTANPLSVEGDLTDNQTLSVSGNDLTISDGNTITLPAASGGDDWGTQTVETDATITGEGTTTNPLSAVDGDATNELQTLDLSGTVLTLSDGGGSVTLPSSGGGDNWGTQTVVSDATLSGEGTTANPISVVGDLTDNQTLSLSGNDLSISDGNTVTLPEVGNLWTESANNIYRNGAVGINSTAMTGYALTVNKGVAAANLLLNSDGEVGVTLRRYATTNSSRLLFTTEDGSSDGFNIGQLGDNNFKITPINLYSNGLEMDPTGNIYFKNNINIEGTLKVEGGAPGAGKVLTSDATGLASWQTPATGSSLWTKNVNDIYYNTGKIGIGTNAPSFDIDIRRSDYATIGITSTTSNAHFIIDKGNTSLLADIIYRTSGSNKFYAGLLENDNYRISTSANSLNGLEVNSAGDVNLSNNLNVTGTVKIEGGTPATGKVLTSDANGLASWQTPATGSSLWTESGSDIYRSSGKIGIGTNSPSYMLDIRSSTGLASLGVKSNTGNAIIYLDRKNSGNYAYILHRTNSLNKFYVGLLGDNNYKISAGSSTLNGLEVTSDGNVNLSNDLNISNDLGVSGDVFINQNLEVSDDLDVGNVTISGGKVYTTTTGAGNNLLPFAYGSITKTGGKTGCTSNVGIVTKHSTGQFTVSIAGLGGTGYTVIVTPNGSIAYATSAIAGKTSTSFVATVWDTKNDAYYDGGFSFIVYKP